MNLRLATMLWLSVTVHAAVLAPVYFAAVPEMLPISAAPLRVALSTSAGSADAPAGAAESAVRSVTRHPPSRTAAPVVAPMAELPLGFDADPARGSEGGNHLRTFLVTQLERYFVYPMLARRRGWQGEVAVALRIESDGRVRALRVARSSGYAVLDRDALATLNRIGVLPHAGPWLPGHTVDTEVPVVYRLTEG